MKRKREQDDYDPRTWPKKRRDAAIKAIGVAGAMACFRVSHELREQCLTQLSHAKPNVIADALRWADGVADYIDEKRKLNAAWLCGAAVVGTSPTADRARPERG